DATPDCSAAKAGEFRALAVRAIADIGAAEWDGCANPHAATVNPGPLSNCQDETFNPFISHAFLAALEASKSVGGHSGWLVQHLALRSSDNSLAAVAPCYVKTHSRGEYVFDYGGAEAYARAGGSYYPKLQVAVPFTPATGRRLLVGSGAAAEGADAALAAGLVELCRLREASSAHVTFMSESEWRFLGRQGFLQR